MLNFPILFLFFHIDIEKCRFYNCDRRHKRGYYAIMKETKIHKYGYSSPTDGTYEIDGKTFSVEQDFRTKEKYREYKEVGFDTLLLQGNDPYLGEPFETSQTKKNMDMAWNVGIERVIIFDKRINDLSHTEGGLVGKGKLFATNEELQNILQEYIKDYSKHPAFLGVMLIDEPSYKCFKAIGQIESAIQAIDNKIFCQCNLLPLARGTERSFCEDWKDISFPDAYKKYLDDFCKTVPQGNLIMDTYPIREENEAGKFIVPFHFSCLQIFHDTAKRHGWRTTRVLQSTAMYNDKTWKFRMLNEKTLAYQYHTALAFGASEISYFTYWRKQCNKTDFEFYPDKTAFISQNGEKTLVYYAVQALHRRYADFEEILCRYKYENSTFFGSDECLWYTEQRPIDGLKAFAQTPYLVTHLKGVTDNSNMYAAQNLLDPDVYEGYREIALDFGEAEHLIVYKNGGERKVLLKNGKYIAKLEAGEVEFYRPITMIK